MCPRSVGLPHSSFLAHYNMADCFQLHFNWLLCVFFLMLKEIFGSVYIHPHTFLGYYVAISTCAITSLLFPLWQSIMLFPSVPAVLFSLHSLCVFISGDDLMERFRSSFRLQVLKCYLFVARLLFLYLCLPLSSAKCTSISFVVFHCVHAD